MGHRNSLISSLVLHAAVITVATIGVPFMKSREFIIPPAPIAIDYIEIGMVTETDTVAKRVVETKKPVNEEAPPPLPEKKKVQEKAEVNKSAEVKTPTAKPEVKTSKSDAKKAPENKEVLDENVLPKKDDKTKETSNKKKDDKIKETSSDNFSSVLKNLMEDEEETFQGKSGINAPLGSKMTISEQDALRSQLEKCWNVPFGAKGVEDVLVEVEITVGPDRTVRAAKILDKSRYSNDTFYRAIADSALRAVRSPICSPLNLPSDKYDLWKTITVRFNPKDMF